MEEATRHKAFIVEQLERLNSAGQAEFASKLLELSGKAELGGLARVKQGVDAIVAGRFKSPTSSSARSTTTTTSSSSSAGAVCDEGPTFAQFARRWTSGELRRDHRDHVAEKRSVQEDIYRLDAHVYPIVGEIPLRQFTIEHAEAVMRSLPEDRASGTRRHVAQLMSRVLKLAVYPGRIIEQSPIPRGFLPKPGSAKALAWLYPKEDAALLANTAVPLLHRVFYGFLDREGLRSGEAGALTWSDLDLETGILTLDANKTDDPRAWAMGKDVVAALLAWKALNSPVTADGPVFASKGKRPMSSTSP